MIKIYSLAVSEELIMKDILERQISYFCSYMNTIPNPRASLNRISHFLTQEMHIYHLEKVTSKSLETYILFHKSIGFSLISFSQVLKDIKIFIRFLEFHNYKVDIDKNMRLIDLLRDKLGKYQLYN